MEIDVQTDKFICCLLQIMIRDIGGKVDKDYASGRGSQGNVLGDTRILWDS